jgi:hypothetical protein
MENKHTIHIILIATGLIGSFLLGKSSITQSKLGGDTGEVVEVPVVVPQIEYVEVAASLTERQVYILTEILQGRTPAFDLSKDADTEIVADYASVNNLIGNKMPEVALRCQNSKEEGVDKSCNLYETVITKVDEVKAKVEAVNNIEAPAEEIIQ